MSCLKITILKFTLKFSLKLLRHVSVLQLHRHGTNVVIIRDTFHKNPNFSQFFILNRKYILIHVRTWGTAVAQWLKCCATNRKVAGSIPASVSGYFIDIKSFRSHYDPGVRSHYDPGVDSASNRNEYQEHFLGVKAASA